jgi:hypothetical protein
MFMPDIDVDIPELAGEFDMEWVEFELPHAESRAAAAAAAATPTSAKRIRIEVVSSSEWMSERLACAHRAGLTATPPNEQRSAVGRSGSRHAEKVETRAWRRCARRRPELLDCDGHGKSQRLTRSHDLTRCMPRHGGAQRGQAVFFGTGGMPTLRRGDRVSEDIGTTGDRCRCHRRRHRRTRAHRRRAVQRWAKGMHSHDAGQDGQGKDRPRGPFRRPGWRFVASHRD